MDYTVIQQFMIIEDLLDLLPFNHNDCSVYVLAEDTINMASIVILKDAGYLEFKRDYYVDGRYLLDTGIRRIQTKEFSYTQKTLEFIAAKLTLRML